MEIKNACKRFDGKPVLEGLSLRLPQSGTVCLFGPSGCGKTTLLQCIAGLERLDSGDITGTQGKKISCVFQEDRLLPWISAQGNVEAVLRGGAKQNRAEARRWLCAVGLAGEEEKRPAELSGGMRQRVSIARALAYGGDLYLLDEPFHALDEKVKREVIALFREQTSGALKIFVTHDRSEADTFADIVYVLEGPPLHIAHRITKC